MPQLSWLCPIGLGVSSIAAAIILCSSSTGAGTRALPSTRRRRTPSGPRVAAVITTVILVITYVLVAYEVRSFSVHEVGLGLNEAMTPMTSSP